MHVEKVRPRRSRLLAPALFLALGGAALALAFASGGGGQAEDPAGVPRIRDGLCSAFVSAEEGDVAAAEDAFDRVHGALHELAARATRADREAAADLLEAKQSVEADLGATGASQAPTLAADLIGLVRASESAGRAVGDDPGGSC